MFLSTVELKEILKSVPVGYKPPDDEFFSAANKSLIPAFKKLGVIKNIEEDGPSSSLKDDDRIHCTAPGCFMVFSNVSSFQAHYNSCHRYICADCKKSLPTPHLLDLHLSELHDTYFQARVDRGDRMYACFLEECKEMSANPADRKDHCIKAHKFPSNFRFDQVAGIKKNKCGKGNKMDVDDMNATKAIQPKQKAFNFGHSKEPSFNSKSKKDAGTLENFDDLAKALDE